MGCMNIVIYLLQHDAKPNHATVRGETPLHLAARANQADIIRILLRNRAEVDARARVRGDGREREGGRERDIIRILLRNRAEVDARARVRGEGREGGREGGRGTSSASCSGTGQRWTPAPG